MLRATILRHELVELKSSSQVDSVTSLENIGITTSKKARFSDSKNTHYNEYAIHTLPSTTRLDVLPSPKSKDGLVRVHTFSHHGAVVSRTVSRLSGQHQGHCNSPRRRSTEKKKSYIFGETEYLRDKLGFCMPPVKQTLAKEHLQQEALGTQGYQYMLRQRLTTVHQLLLDHQSTARQQFIQRSNKNRRLSLKDEMPPQLTGPQKKKTTASEQYIILLDANTRRAKQLDEKIKFAVTQAICRHQNISNTLEKASENDHLLALEARSRLEKERKKERKRRKQLQDKKQVRIMAPRSGGDIEESEGSSDTTPSTSQSSSTFVSSKMSF